MLERFAHDQGVVPGPTDILRRGSLRKPIREFLAHYHLERNHQGLGNRLITPEAIPADSNGTIQRTPAMGGMLNYYHRAAVSHTSECGV